MPGGSRSSRIRKRAGLRSIVADVESGTVTFHAAGKDVVIAVRFDELLEIMAEGVVLSHQRNDTEAPGGEGDGGQ